ncbi:DMT family transporter [Actinoplanes regularis]|nr:DMT family transporter [Actinoplanes regularis]
MTVAIVLSLAAALTYGICDVGGGFTSRTVSPWAITVTGQLGGGLAMLAAAAGTSGTVTAGHLGLAGLAGAGSAAGTVYLYRGLASGRSTLVAPLSAVGAAAVPVFAGVTAGERPPLIVWAGILVALPGIWLVATSGGGPRAGTDLAAIRDGALSGLGFGVLFTAVGQIPASAGLLPLAIQNAAAGLVTVAAALALRQSWLPSTRRAWFGLPIGVLGAGGTALFLTATHAGSLTITGVVVSLYPVFTIALSVLLLGERVGRWQGLGVLLCGVSIAFIAAG